MKGEKFNIQASADDLAILLKGPMDSIASLTKTLTEYGAMTRFKIKQ